MSKELAVVIAAVAQYMDMGDIEIKNSRVSLKESPAAKGKWKWSLRFDPFKNNSLPTWRQNTTMDHRLQTR